jgi:hypothetical protein
MSAAAGNTTTQIKDMLGELLETASENYEQKAYLKFAYDEPEDKAPVLAAIEQLHEEGKLKKGVYEAFVNWMKAKGNASRGSSRRQRRSSRSSRRHRRSSSRRQRQRR